MLYAARNLESFLGTIKAALVRPCKVNEARDLVSILGDNGILSLAKGTNLSWLVRLPEGWCKERRSWQGFSEKVKANSLPNRKRTVDLNVMLIKSMLGGVPGPSLASICCARVLRKHTPEVDIELRVRKQGAEQTVVKDFLVILIFRSEAGLELSDL